MGDAKLNFLKDKLDQRLQDKKLNLPVLPQVTSQVLQLTSDTDSNAADLAKLIQSDQSLAGHVMRVANSAAFSPNASMVSLQQAVARLGMQTVGEIALASSVNNKLFVAPGFEELVAEVWMFSFAVGAWSREIARYARLNVESLFLSGLLHQIGRPVALQASLEIAAEDQLSLSEDLLVEIMDNFEQSMGLSLVETWQLPQVVSETIRYVGRGSCADPFIERAQVVAAARLFATATYACGGDEDATAQLHTAEAVVAMNLYQEDVEQLLEKQTAIQETVNTLLA